MRVLHFLLKLTAILILSTNTFSQRGTLDYSFGDSGKVTTKFIATSSVAFAVALQNDNKIVVTGGNGYTGVHPYFNIATSRYLPDGRLDSSFGIDGKIVSQVGNDSKGNAIVIQPDKKILIAGDIYVGDEDGFGVHSFGLLRYLPNGFPDSSFGIKGRVKTTLKGGYAWLSSLSLQTDNKIIAAGISKGKFALVRYQQNGEIDHSFGDSGVALNDFGIPEIYTCSMILQPNGKILVAGTDYSNIILGRYLQNGTVDSAFGDNGVIIKNIETNYPYPALVQLKSDGHILVAATNYSYYHPNIVLTQFNEYGKPDSSFGINGVSILNDLGIIFSFKVSSSNNLYLLAGYNPFVISCNANGFIDSSFGINGIAEQLSIDEQHAIFLNKLVLQPDNKVLVVGDAELLDPQNVSSFLIARYNNDIILPITFQNFTATKQYNNALLKWQTSTEQNNHYFIIQRSVDGSNFSEIGNIKSKSNSSNVLEYSFIDANPKTGKNYYRLKQVNMDEHFTYSSVALVDFNNLSSIIIAPNPAQNILTIKGLGNQKDLSIVDVKGNIISKATSIIDIYNWNISNLPVGVYYLIVEEKGKRISTIKFIKQ